MSQIQDAAILLALIRNGLQFRLFRPLARPVKPWYLELAVTNRCNSRCAMCRIWQLQGQVADKRSLEPAGREIASLLTSLEGFGFARFLHAAGLSTAIQQAFRNKGLDKYL